MTILASAGNMTIDEIAHVARDAPPPTHFFNAQNLTGSLVNAIEVAEKMYVDGIPTKAATREMELDPEIYKPPGHPKSKVPGKALMMLQATDDTSGSGGFTLAPEQKKSPSQSTATTKAEEPRGRRQPHS